MAERSISFDRKCTGCGYNLRGLPGTGACPECGRPVLDSLDQTIKRIEESLRGPRLGAFDKFCAVLAAVLGVVLVIMGMFGLFIGVSASFSLPPILGLLPTIVGWGILRSVRIAFFRRDGGT